MCKDNKMAFATLISKLDKSSWCALDEEEEQELDWETFDSVEFVPQVNTWIVTTSVSEEAKEHYSDSLENDDDVLSLYDSIEFDPWSDTWVLCKNEKKGIKEYYK